MSQVLINNISSAKKVQRIYRLTVQNVDSDGMPIDEAIVIQNPITVEFSVNRTLFADVNTLDIEIYNLAPQTYNQLFFDYFNMKYRTIILEAGYETTGLSTIFIGDVWSCYTRREKTNTITKIHAIVGLKSLQAFTDMTLGGITRDRVLAAVAKDMNLELEIYSGQNIAFERDVVLSDNSMKIAQQYSDNNAYIDNGKLIILNDVDAIKGDVPLINDESGLLGVPQHEDAILSVEIMFDPRFIIGQIIEIRSRIHPQFNGQYKVYGIKHDATISGAESGSASTTLEMLVGSQVYGRFGVVTRRHEKDAY